jgi:2-polyprenyl-6-methoxyphenol hydroxylase-like FAD-dependent oxidoreductase
VTTSSRQRLRRGRDVDTPRPRGGNFDITIIGGGIAGSALAITLRRSGRDVALVEQSRRFRDRVRGEGLAPWGTALAASLAIDKLLRERASAQELPYWDTWAGDQVRRDVLAERDPHGRGVLTFHHHCAQEILIEHAAQLGVNVVRPAKAIPRDRSQRTWTTVAGDIELRSPLLVLADGRISDPNGAGKTGEHSDPRTHLVNGALLCDLDVDGLAVSTVRSPTGRLLIFPLNRSQTRVYHMTTAVAPQQRTPKTVRAAMLKDLESVSPGVARCAKFVGLCASFSNASRWPSTIVSDGLARIGDAAGSTDPSIGQGLAITLRDVSELANGLTQEVDINVALERYAEQRARYFAVQRIVALVSWCLDAPTEDGARYRRKLALSDDLSRRALLREIRRDPASVDAGPDLAAALLGVLDRDSSLDALPAIFGSVPYARSATTVPT